MSVVINTNSAATIAAGNLAESNRMLQKSLNRLSSGSKIVNASDDAGGVAVAARLSAAAVRTQGAIGNISSALSFLQQQDSALKTGSKIMQRMNELQILFRDDTKSTDDKAQYTTEFDKLKAQYVAAVRNAQFNGIDMMKSAGAIDVTVNEGLSQYSLSNLSTYVSDASSWTIDGGYHSMTGTAIVNPIGSTDDGNLVLKVFDGAVETSATIAVAEGETLGEIVDNINASTLAVTASISSDGFLKLTADNAGDEFYVHGDTTNAVRDALGLTEGSRAGSVITDGSVADASSDTLDEIQNLATARAKNGADQSVLEYYSELATATKINFEAAVSRIMDVDVAQESTQLARWNTLVQAGTAMMAQANGSTLSALSLLRS